MDATKTIQINLDPALYALDNAQILFDEESFKFLMVSGKKANQYSMSPRHAKRMFLLLQQQVGLYEEKYGELKTSLPVMKGQTEDKSMGFRAPSA